ncbi:MAG: TonB-dependent receptor plug domain-containing protein, partial [Gemmatimonadales bacterium]
MTLRTRLLTAVLLLAATPGYAQNAADSTRATLDRKISVSFDRVDLATALTQLRTRHGVPLAFSSDALPENRSVSVAAREQPVHLVLDRMLDGTGLRIFPVTGGALVIARPVAVAIDTVRPRSNIASSVRTLEQLVVTGTATSAAALPTDDPGSVNVIRTDDLDGQRFSRTADLFRATLPGLILRDQGPSGAPAEVLAVRGASSFTARGLKAYIDGVEMASPTLVTLVDPRSIERIEVIRGPQGAALYGSDAINGVIQITTRKGRVGESVRLQGSAEVAAGSFDQSALSTVLRHDYAGLLTGGTAWGAGALSGSMARVGSDQPLPGARTWNMHAGAKLAVGSLVLSGMARGGQYDFAQSEYRRFEISSAPVAAMTASIGAATLGFTALHQTTDWWNQSLVAGYDVTSGALGTPRSYLYANRTTLPASNQERASRATLRYSSTATAGLGHDNELTTTAGVEVTRLTRNRGTWESMASSNLAISSYDDQVRNVGTFMQSKLVTGPLTLNAGLRAERSSSFGGDRGAAWSPSVGAAWTQPIGSWALRLRTGWGRGIRPPEPGMSLGLASGSYEQLANPDLAPESQAGVEF